MKLLVREIQKSLPQKHFDYLLGLLDLTFFGCMLVWDLRSLKKEEQEANGAASDTLDRCAKSVKGINSLKIKCAAMENPNPPTDGDDDAAADGEEDGQEDKFAGLLSSGLSTTFDSYCEDELFTSRVAKIADEYATTEIGNIFTQINNATKKMHSEELWKKNLSNRDVL